MPLFSTVSSIFFYSIFSISLCLSYHSFAETLSETDSLRLQQQQLLQLNLEDLFNLEVTSVAKKTQRLSHSAAAIFVITQEDIRRSGATQVAELLRMVPGFQVERFNSYSWRVAARGSFNGVYVNKLLVLIDGRSFYNPQISGTYWDRLDIMLEDIERIEVIRGSGGTLWGANAVNGVVNIITKQSQDTQGNLLVAGGGVIEQRFLRFRHGGILDEENNASWRVYGKTTARDSLANGVQPDSWQAHQTGFRIDAEPSITDQLVLQGDIYQLQGDQIDWETLAAGDGKTMGSNLLSRWQHYFTSNAQLSTQLYYDFSKQIQPNLGVDNHFIDFETQYQFDINETHEILTGIGYRWLFSHVAEDSDLKRDSLDRYDQVFSAFVQDEMRLLPDELHLILGSKFEHNDYTGFEIQPNVRLLWIPSTTITTWAALSRAVRTPSQVSDHILGELATPAVKNPFYPMPLIISLQGNDSLVAESVFSYELGFRNQINKHYNWDIAGFYNQYNNLVIRSDIPMPDLANQRILILSRYHNGMEGHTFGIEATANITQEHWKLSLVYSYLRMQMHINNNIVSDFENIEQENPHHQISLRLMTEPMPNWQLDGWLRYMDALPLTDNYVNSYINLDVRVAWQMTKNIEFSLIGQNLLDKQQMEFYAGTFNPLVSEVKRNFYGQIRWEF